MGEFIAPGYPSDSCQRPPLLAVQLEEHVRPLFGEVQEALETRSTSPARRTAWTRADCAKWFDLDDPIALGAHCLCLPSHELHFVR
ncbi:hypothetical protein EON63_06810 [archaeon]|nr:MAG: hypothetical protein EON63_06810 [archaeon]